MKTIPIQPVGLADEHCSASELLALQVLDDSMAPEFNPGHVVVIDSSAKISSGAFVLVEILNSAQIHPLDEPGNNWLIRQWQPLDSNEIALKTVNPDWSDQSFQESEIQVRGIVVQRAGRRRHERRIYRQ